MLTCCLLEVLPIDDFTVPTGAVKTTSAKLANQGSKNMKCYVDE